MKRINLKRTFTLVLFVLMVVAGSTQVADAQRRHGKRDKHHQRADNRRNHEKHYRYRHNGKWYTTTNYGAQRLRQAVNVGYRQGYYAGQRARLNRRGSTYYYRTNVYRNGTYGYQHYVDAGQYRYYFREGFERGYRDGYYR